MAPKKRSESSRLYTDLTTLGSGGMAKVYRAHQDSLARDVAIKELRADLARDPSIVARFEREARYAAMLQHEAIVHVYDYFREGSSYYIVMEYVEGTDLSAIVKRLGKLPPDITAAVALRICRALEHAHSRGIIHRDIKPANALVSKNGEVKLSDFGIAKDPFNARDDMTQTGQAVGTPSYMSPEQILGDAVDYRSDLFSLGILMYEMLSGMKPFVADTQGALLDKIRSQGYRDVRRVASCPRALAKIVRRCLRKEPRKRWESTTEMRRALEAFAFRQISISQDEHIKNWLYKAGIFDAPKVAPPNATAVQVETRPSRTRMRTWGPRVAFAGLAGAGLATLFLYPIPLEELPLLPHGSRPSVTSSRPAPTPTRVLVTTTNGKPARR